MSLTASAQVSRNGEGSSTPVAEPSTRSTPAAEPSTPAAESSTRVAEPSTRVAEPPPTPPTYTPEQLFGTREPPTVAPPDTSRAAVSQPVSTPPSATATPAPASSPQPCSVPAPTATQFPGVSASQLPRAGVSAEAFTRPGVSAAELDALRPGARSSPCAPPRQVHLYPETAEQPRPIVTAADD
jgi:hypothetical protein